MSTRRDPFDVPLLLLRTAWMDRYRGKQGGDTMVHGGSFVADNEYGHEMFNFLPFKGRCCGYVRPPGWADDLAKGTTIDIQRLGGTPGAESVAGVLAVWVATHPDGGGLVVGWYKNATIYRDWQETPPDPARHYGEDEEFGFYATARTEDAVLLPAHERLFPVPKAKEGGFGQANVFYAADRTKHRKLREALLKYIDTRQAPKTPTKRTASRRQPDPLLRQKVELAAIKETTAYFKRLGYAVDSVERDNCGWDLEAAFGSRGYKLEVKGLSGAQTVVELTPNEYAAMKAHRDTYRVCVVTDALTKPGLEVYAYNLDAGRWESTIAPDRVLDLTEIVAARCAAS